MMHKNRIKKLEEQMGGVAPQVLIGHSREEADQKLREFRRSFPHAPAPTILIPEPITKRETRDQDWSQNPENLKKP